jgi:hypothetical protein
MAMGGGKDDGFRYDSFLKQCEDEYARIGRNAGYSGECGLLDLSKEGLKPADARDTIKDLRKSKQGMKGVLLKGLELAGDDHLLHWKEMDLRGAHIAESKLPGALFEKASLQAATFEKVVLKGASFLGADLSQAVFRDVNLENADFRGADVSGAVFEIGRGGSIKRSKWKGAKYDDASMLPFPCEYGQHFKMVYLGNDPDHCKKQEWREASVSASFASRYPEILAIRTKDSRVARLYHIRELTLEALGPADLTDDEKRELVCATRMKACVKKGRRAAEDYVLERLPKAVLERGIELVHDDYESLDRVGVARFSGAYRVASDPSVLRMLKDPALLEAARVDLGVERVEGRSWLSDMNIAWKPYWMGDAAGGKTGSYHHCRREKLRGGPIRCRVSMTFEKPAGASEGWAEQLGNSLIRAASAKTLGAQFQAYEYLQWGFPTPRVMDIPVLRINLTTLDSQMVPRRVPGRENGEE